MFLCFPSFGKDEIRKSKSFLSRRTTAYNLKFKVKIMKKALFTVSLTAALSLSTALGWSNNVSFASKPWIQVSPVAQGKRSFSHFLALGTNENLKAYHLGLRSIFPNYYIPSAEDLLSSIRSHSQFIGLMSQTEGQQQFQERKSPYLIFEEKDNVPGHFYIAHPGGLRHFTVNNKTLAGIDNGMNSCFPKLNHFVQSTLLL